jgi:hypothetical protein
MAREELVVTSVRYDAPSSPVHIAPGISDDVIGGLLAGQLARQNVQATYTSTTTTAASPMPSVALDVCVA